MIRVHAYTARRPCDPLAFHKFSHFGFDAYAKSLPAESRSKGQIRTIAIGKNDVGGVYVPLRPPLGANQPGPNGRSLRLHEELVLNVNAGARGLIRLRPANL